MKRALLVLMSVFIAAFTCCAQERVNDPVLTFNKCSNKVTNIIGWFYDNKEGQWVDNPNFIHRKKEPFYNDKRFSNGANYVQIKTFINNGETYYVLIIAFNGGHYIYPNIKEDWRPYVEYNVYLLTKDEYEFIVDPSGQKSFELRMINYDEYYDKYTDNRLIREVISEKIYAAKISITKYNDVIRFIYNYYLDEKALMKTEYFEVSVTDWNNLKIN